MLILESKMIKTSISVMILLLALLVSGVADAKAKRIDDSHWTGVDRVVAIADIHGDYGQYFKAMRSAGLIDKSGKWSGGETHLVQTGDIPDRGPDTIKIIDHLEKLRKQARKAGGYVHLLIGNHEAMNVEGDLRYVSPGEYAAFTTKNSARLREMQWQRQLEWMKANMPDFAEIDLEAYRKEWDQQVPLGWVEHRQAWSLNGPYGKYVEGNQVAVQINDTIFVHGGISAKYCALSLETMTDDVHSALKNYDRSVQTIVDDPLGPLWYRGLALEKESDDVFSQTLDNILERYGAKRIVVGHTPTGGVVWPRFDRRVIANDTGLATYYGAHMGVLELTADGITAIYGDNEGRVDYLRAVIEADPNNAQMKQRLARLLAPADSESGEVSDGEPEDAPVAVDASPVPGTCQ